MPVHNIPESFEVSGFLERRLLALSPKWSAEEMNSRSRQGCRPLKAQRKNIHRILIMPTSFNSALLSIHARHLSGLAFNVEGLHVLRNRGIGADAILVHQGDEFALSPN